MSPGSGICGKQLADSPMAGRTKSSGARPPPRRLRAMGHGGGKTTLAHGRTVALPPKPRQCLPPGPRQGPTQALSSSTTAAPGPAAALTRKDGAASLKKGVDPGVTPGCSIGTLLLERDQPEPPRAADPCCTPGAGHSENDREAAAQREATSVSLEGTRPVRYRIDKMDCPTEEGLIRNRLEAMPEIVHLDFNLMAR